MIRITLLPVLLLLPQIASAVECPGNPAALGTIDDATREKIRAEWQARHDKVLTAGGIVGVVIGVKETTVSLRSADSKLEVLKSTISEITEKAGADAVSSQP